MYHETQPDMILIVEKRLKLKRLNEENCVLPRSKMANVGNNYCPMFFFE